MSTGRNAHVSVVIHSTATPDEMWAALSRVLPVKSGGTSQWVELFEENLSVTFFGPSVVTEPEPEPVAEPAPVTA